MQRKRRRKKDAHKLIRYNVYQLNVVDQIRFMKNRIRKIAKNWCNKRLYLFDYYYNYYRFWLFNFEDLVSFHRSKIWISFCLFAWHFFWWSEHFQSRYSLKILFFHHISKLKLQQSFLKFFIIYMIFFRLFLIFAEVELCMWFLLGIKLVNSTPNCRWKMKLWKI